MVISKSKWTAVDNFKERSKWFHHQLYSNYSLQSKASLSDSFDHKLQVGSSEGF